MRSRCRSVARRFIDAHRTSVTGGSSSVCSTVRWSGPDRQAFSYHDFTRLGGLNYDACLRVHVSPSYRILLWIVWGLVVLVTMGTVRPRILSDRARGWLRGVAQDDYEALVIDPVTGAGSPGPARLRDVPFQ